MDSSLLEMQGIDVILRMKWFHLELKELKVQLQDAIDKRFIQPSTLSWEVLIWLVKERMDPYGLCINYR